MIFGVISLGWELRLMNQLKPLAFYFCLGILFVPFFQNCGEHIQGVSEDSTGVIDVSERSACDQNLFDHFSKTYLESFNFYGCSSCHSSGGLRSVSPFGDEDFPDDAFLDFLEKGPQNISNRVLLEGHNSGTLGYNKNTYGAELEGYRAEWVKISESCVAADTSLETSARKASFFEMERAGDFPRNELDENGEPSFNNGTCGFNDPILVSSLQGEYSAELPQIDTFVWDLGEYREDLQGISISLDVRINSANFFSSGTLACPSSSGYRAGRIRVTSDKDVRIKNIHVRIDGDNKNVRDFFLERFVEAGVEDLPLFGSGSSMVTFPMAVEFGDNIVVDNEWTLFFEEIEIQKEENREDPEEEGSDSPDGSVVESSETSEVGSAPGSETP